MHRKNYEAIASVLSNVRGERHGNGTVAMLDVSARLADLFAEDNPKFDRHRFLVACMAKKGK